MRFYALDIFRFFAALSVVFYHYTAREGSGAFAVLAPVTKFGYLGVPFFFIISGFVISASAHNRTAADFLVSRAVRLYPAYWAGLLFTTVIVFFYGRFDITLMQFFANLTMMNDLVHVKNIDGAYWTLQAELKFYGCVFLLILYLCLWWLMSSMSLLRKNSLRL